MKYRVSVKETSYATVEVEAESPQAAEDLAWSSYCEGHMDWDDSEIDFNAEPVERDRKHDGRER